MKHYINVIVCAMTYERTQVPSSLSTWYINVRVNIYSDIDMYMGHGVDKRQVTGTNSWSLITMRLHTHKMVIILILKHVIKNTPPRKLLIINTGIDNLWEARSFFAIQEPSH